MPSRTYWLTAPDGVDTRPIDTAFAFSGWTRLDPSIDPATAISRAGFVVGLLGAPGQNERVFAELGFALGRHRRVGALRLRGAELQPRALASLKTFDFRHPEAVVSLADDLVPALVEAGTEIATARGHSRGLGRLATDLIESLGAQPTELAVVDALAKAFRHSGAKVLTEMKAGRGRVDLALWERGLGARLNPVLIEVRRRAGSGLPLAYQQVQSYMNEADGRLGVIVFVGHDAAFVPGLVDAEGRPVIAVELTTLMDQLRDDDFRTVVDAYLGRPIPLTGHADG